jgi:hypothetical protein
VCLVANAHTAQGETATVNAVDLLGDAKAWLAGMETANNDPTLKTACGRYAAMAQAAALTSIAASLVELTEILDNANRLEELKAGVEMVRR